MPGYNSQRSSNCILPATLKCSVCLKDKEPRANFSSTQLETYRRYCNQVKKATRGKATDRNGNLIDHNVSDLYIRCKVCTGVQPEQMTCKICRKSKPLNKFALAQRKCPDDARCGDCMRSVGLVNPVSALIDAQDDINDDDGDNAGIGGSKGAQQLTDHFWKDASGQYWTRHDSDVTSVSNPWDSRIGSEAGFRGPIASVASESVKDDESVYSESTAGLSKRMNRLGLGHQEGIINKSLARGKAPVSVSSSGTGGSESSEDTVRNGGVRLGGDKGKSPAAYKARTVSFNPYDDSDGDEDDDVNITLMRPMRNRVEANLYDDDDEASGGHPPVSNAGTSLYAPSTASGISNDWKGTSRTPRTYASGFRDRQFKSEADSHNTKKFARVRPTNMHAADADKSILHRKFDNDSGYRKGRKLEPGQAGSDED